MIKSNVVIVGAGIVGMTLAYELLQRHKGLKIIFLEKEPAEASHASGRNSGVLHAGFYYNKDSLKAALTKAGNMLMKDYCLKHGLALAQNGKLVVAKNESELPTLFELSERGNCNQSETRLVTEQEAKKIEPYIKTHKYALFSPLTATVDPKAVCRTLREDLEKRGVQFYFQTPYERRLNSQEVQAGPYTFGYSLLINTAGLYADRIAHDFNIGNQYTILPFKGIYLKNKNKSFPLRTNIYPVPSLENTFLGVHFTIEVNGLTKIGPTAMPAFWRENYKGVQGFNLKEFTSILSLQTRLFAENKFNFRNLAINEMKKLCKKTLIKQVKPMVEGLDLTDFKIWAPPGIRAQLLHRDTKELIQDFVVEPSENSLHILNAISPAFTSSFAFAKWILDKHPLSL